MIKLIKWTSIGLMALAIAGIQLELQAQEADAPAAKAKVASRKGTGPFNGKVVSVDTAAGTVTVGKRTFKISSETKVTNGSLASANVGDKVGGAFRTEDDGTLVATTIWFGAKPEK